MTSLIGRVLVSVLVSASLAACAHDRTVGAAPGIEVADVATLPVPQDIGVYTIGAQDTLQISVIGSEMLSGTFLTDEEGYLQYPLVGDILVGGKTPSQAARMIADGLRGRYVVNPQVSVRPDAIAAPTISVGGEVEAPGTYPAATSVSLVRAVNNAGGLSAYAKSDDVLVLRTVDGQRYIGAYNIEAIQRGNYDDPAIYPNDVVTVGDSPFRRTLETVLRFVPLLSTSVILFDRAGS
ncbi:polysaccharide biosynthesis/export family protein [Pelagerythrobacter sp.]|uniref:polysaccharide biosynthesis/export family protein n=1 Tax=Pelagerythrobacter sp. TaxID=2800702 RepID=UPI0035AF6945